MDALRRKDGPQKGNVKKGEQSRWMEGNIEDCSFFLVAVRKKWMGPIIDLEMCSAVVVILCSRCHEKGRRTLQINENMSGFLYY
jgi:hypothetical protein